MRTHALLLMCGVTALISGVAYFGIFPNSRLSPWLLGLFVCSSLLSLLFLLVLVVSAALRSIDAFAEQPDEQKSGKDDPSNPPTR